MKKVLFTVVVLILVTTFGISAFMVGSYLIDGKKQADRYNELSNIAANAQTEQNETKANATEETTEPTEETTAPTTAPTTPRPTTPPATEPSHYTVTFRYNGTTFAAQTVQRNRTAEVPKLQPTASGSWNFDFTTPIIQDTVIDWNAS